MKIIGTFLEQSKLLHAIKCPPGIENCKTDSWECCWECYSKNYGIKIERELLNEVSEEVST